MSDAFFDQNLAIFNEIVMTHYANTRNVSEATVKGIRDLVAHGSIVSVRNQEVRELLNRVTHLTEPRERCLFVPRRGNNIFATIAETIWVVSGRNDIGWLENYLPRAGEFSDDGAIWRAAYGPRLRDWRGIDQLDEVRKLLLAESATRRAVISLFDPAADFVASKDIPCTNWLHWIVRDGKLQVNVALRSCRTQVVMSGLIQVKVSGFGSSSWDGD